MSTPAFLPSGIVTLLSDFGTRDPYVGIMKGVLYREAPGLRAAIDLTHEVPAQDVRTASFFLGHAWRWFPAGTVHVAVVDPTVGTDRAILVLFREGHAFLAPDNGLLTPLLDAREGQTPELYRLAGEEGDAPESRTFHGRDLFAPAAARLASAAGLRRAGLVGERVAAPVRLELPALARRPDGVLEATVLLVDRFGNLVTNAAASDLSGAATSDLGGAAAGGGGGLKGWTAEVGERRIRAVATYAEAEVGETVVLENSYGLVEIAVRDGDAARELGIGQGAGVVFREGA